VIYNFIFSKTSVYLFRNVKKKKSEREIKELCLKLIKMHE